jgi:hypothetical protein
VCAPCLRGCLKPHHASHFRTWCCLVCRIAYANHSLGVRLCNKDVPFPITFQVGCGIQKTQAPDNPWLDLGVCGDFMFFIPSWLDPWTALSGSQKTSLPCL